VSSITTPKSLTHFLKPTGQRYLFRHSGTLQYYAVKTTAGKKVRHPLETSDRKLAERKLLAWLDSLTESRSTGDAASTTVGQLLTLFLELRASLAKSTVVRFHSVMYASASNPLPARWFRVVRPFAPPPYTAACMAEAFRGLARGVGLARFASITPGIHVM